MNDQMCRLCLQISYELFPIFDEELNNYNTIMSIATLEISEFDEYPKYMCYLCDSRLREAYEFKTMCETSDQFLRNSNDLKNIIHKDATVITECDKEDSVETSNANLFKSDLTDVVKVKLPVKCNFESLHTKNEVRNDKEMFHEKPEASKTKINYNKENINNNRNISHKCFFCNEEFSTKQQLSEHKDSHAPPFICHNCGKELPSLKSLKFHEKTHQPGNQEFRCKICDSTFLSRSALSGHHAKHAGTNNMACDVCNKIISSKNMKRHKQTHSGERPFPCTICGARYTRSTYLKLHMDEHPDLNNLYNCSFCGYTTDQLKDILKHRSFCTTRRYPRKQTKFLCNWCGKVFKSKGGLGVHEQTHGEQKRFSCTVCSKGFIQKGALERHFRVHSGAKPYKCKLCTKSFNQSGHLKVHMVIHSGSKNFKCDLCDKKFYQGCALQYHMMTHTGEKPYSCNICNRAFNIKYRLKTHMSKSHNISIDISQIKKE